jgi:hypothetical protein
MTSLRARGAICAVLMHGGQQAFSRGLTSSRVILLQAPPESLPKEQWQRESLLA